MVADKILQLGDKHGSFEGGPEVSPSVLYLHGI